MRTMPALPGRLRAMLPGAKPLGVDREAKVIRGYVVAQLGAFKTAGRGQFDDASLRQIVDLMGKHPKGLRSRFAHPTESNDGLGSYLGRAKNPRMDGDRVRADLHLDPTSFSSPNGNLGGYLLDLAESDSDALSSSLVLQADKEAVLDAKGKPALDQDGQPVPPVWRPTKLHASDIVDTGDAVDGLLSAGVDVDGMPLGALWRGAELLDGMFAGQSRDVIEARCKAWLDRYLSLRFGDDAGQTGYDPDILLRRGRLRDIG